ncbi:MAG: hypothetical protein EOM67_16985, partial [Spirochaetia bacterium]|nr:hypothetical protein [Spirochaetia bacterium]
YKKTKRGNGKRVLEISSHNTGDIITILTEKGKESSYTKNHRCLARIHLKGNEHKSVTYIMRNKQGYYRVGSTQLFVLKDRNFGVRARMNAEKADCAWILDVFDTPQEAWLAEQICAYKFGIPQTTWVTANTQTSGKDLESLYNHLGDLTNSVSDCLNLYGRDIKYPIFTSHSGTHFSKIHVTEVRACNLIPKVMDIAVPYLTEKDRLQNDYEQIINVKVTRDSVLKVYGIKVEDTETYVSDGILTHNSIYGFKGGNVSLFLRLVEDSDFDTYYLTNNYRNSREILNLADTVISQVSRKITKSISPKIDKDGDVTIMSRNKIREALSQIDDYRNWFVLTRTNKELF